MVARAINLPIGFFIFILRKAIVMRKSRRLLPALEPLESIIALSNMPGPGSPLHALVAQPGHTVFLVGQIHGTWSRPVGVPNIPDAGGTQNLNGGGRLRFLGRVHVAGSLHTPGFIQNGTTTGTLDVANSHGSIHLVLMGSPQPGFSPPPSTLTYTINGGTGRYAHVSGHGTATLTEVPAGSATGASTFVLSFHPSL